MINLYNLNRLKTKTFDGKTIFLCLTEKSDVAFDLNRVDATFYSVVNELERNVRQKCSIYSSCRLCGVCLSFYEDLLGIFCFHVFSYAVCSFIAIYTDSLIPYKVYPLYIV